MDKSEKSKQAKSPRRAVVLLKDLLKRRWSIRIISITIVLLLWELFGKQVGRLILAPPSAIPFALYSMIASGELARNFAISIQHMLLGLALALVGGIGFGLLIGVFKKLEIALDPYVMALFSIPTSGLIPLIMIWFGLGFNAKVIVVFLFCFFPIFLNTASGVKNVDPTLVESGVSFGATKLQMFGKIFLPSAVPYIVAGIRMAVGRALMGMVVAELLLAGIGLGGMMDNASAIFDTATLFAILLVLMLLGIGMTEVVKYAERRVAPWKGK